MLESQQQSLNHVSPEFIPRNMQLVSDEAPNGWAEPPTAAAAAAAAVAPSNEWTETPSADNEWQAGNLFFLFIYCTCICLRNLRMYNTHLLSIHLVI